MELFLRCLPIQESLAHSLLLFHNEPRKLSGEAGTGDRSPVIVPFVLAEPVCPVIWLAKGQIVRSESPNGVPMMMQECGCQELIIRRTNSFTHLATSVKRRHPQAPRAKKP